MAKLKESEITEALGAHLETGETLQQWAVGVRQPGLHIIVPLFALAILPGVIAVQMLTKSYIVGLTDRRLIVLQVKSITNATLREVLEFDRAKLAEAPGTSKTGGLFTHMRIDWPEQSWRAKFHRAFAKGHRAQAMQIGAAISGGAA